MKCRRCRKSTRNAGGFCTDCLNRNRKVKVDEPNSGPCKACKDVVHDRVKFKGKLYCKTCRNELRDGTITNQNTTFFGGSPATQDDISPWQENAIRDLEDY